MIRMSREVRTAAPAAAVYDYLVDFTNAERWDPNAVRVQRLEGAGEVGTRYRVTSAFAGRETDLDYRLTRAEPTTLIELRGAKKALTAVDTITVTELPTGTAVVYAVAFDFHGVLGWFEPLLRVAVRRLLADGADGLTAALAELDPA